MMLSGRAVYVLAPLHLEISQKGQINDRFTKAIEQLGAVDQGGRKRLEVRLGGIYALEQIAKDSPDDHHWPIMEVLTAYVRENAPWKEEEPRSQEEISPREPQPTQSNQAPPRLAADIQAILVLLRQPIQISLARPRLAATDIQAILTVLGRRTRTFGKGEDQRLDLTGTALRSANLWGAHLEEADLTAAHLEGANLVWARLEGAGLLDAHLEGANLADAHLEGAFRVGAHLERANLRGAHLEGLERAMGLTVEQLSTVKTLAQAHLDPPLREQLERLYPHLLKEPQDEARIS